MKQFLFTIVFLLALTDAVAKERSFSSPNGLLKVMISDDAGWITYQVSSGDDVYINPSLLGLVTDMCDLSQGQLRRGKTSPFISTLKTRMMTSENINYPSREEMTPTRSLSATSASFH